MDISYDQHFLTDEEALKTIAESAEIAPDDVVVEVGAGAGQLTRHLLEQEPLQVIGLERDQQFSTALENLDKEYDGFSYRISNALEDLSQLHCSVLVGNIPYAITEPLYKQILELEIGKVVLTHGMHFLQIMESPDHKWHHFIHAFYDVHPIMTIEGERFSPPAKTKSVVVKLTRRLDTSTSIKDRFLQQLYHKKDRNARNALTFAYVDTFKVSKQRAKEKVEGIGLSEQALNTKMENLSNEDCQQAFRSLL